MKLVVFLFSMQNLKFNKIFPTTSQYPKTEKLDSVLDNEKYVKVIFTKD